MIYIGYQLEIRKNIRIMRVFTATLGTETNSFSSIPVGDAGFRSTMWWQPGDHPDFPTEATGPLWICRERAREQGWLVIEGTCAFAMPGGLVARATYEKIRDEILDQLRAALPVDIVALGLHGAMMAHGYPDCEADLLAHIRTIVGSDVAVGAVLDLHAHLSQAMVDAADVLIAFKLFPHTDFLDRSRELLDLLERHVKGEINPVSVLVSPPLIIGFRTDQGPGTMFTAMLSAAEQAPILSASCVQGFSLGDSPEMGTRILVIADGDRVHAESEARRLAHWLMVHRNELYPDRDKKTYADVLAEARIAPHSPVILADGSDNPGGGAGGDSMAPVRALIAAGMGNAACGPIWDPQAVDFASDAGVGAQMALRIGGKSGPDAGAPLDVNVTVTGIAYDAVQKLGDAIVPVGDAVGVEANGVALLLTSLRDQAYDPDLFRAVGIEPAERDYLILKSSQQFRIGFAQISDHVLNLPSQIDPQSRAYIARPRPLWPFEELAS